MRDLVTYPDAEKAVIGYLRPVLEDLGRGHRIDVRGGGGRFVRVRRVGGTEATVAHDRPVLDVLVWDDSDLLRMQVASHLWAALRASDGDTVGDAVLVFDATVLGPRQVPDPADSTESVCMFTVQMLSRAA